jgi:hypothetical protein
MIARYAWLYKEELVLSSPKRTRYSRIRTPVIL